MCVCVYVSVYLPICLSVYLSIHLFCHLSRWHNSSLHTMNSSAPHLTSFHFPSHHITSPLFTSRHFTSLHFTPHHFTSLHFTSLHNSSSIATQANVVSEMFKRTASRANLREALAQRRERKIEREKKNEPFEADLKPVRGISSNSYFGSGNREEKGVSASDLHYATWEEKEEAEILNMAAKVLQQRWRYTR